MRRVLHIGLVLALAASTPALADVVLPPAIAGSPSLKALRKSMLAGQQLSDLQLRALADAGEGLAAARYAKRLEERDDPAFIDDAAHYYSIAVYQGRDFAMPRLLATLTDTQAEFGPARLRNIRGVLDRAARRGDGKAAVGLADLLLQGELFEADVPQARDLLLKAAEAGDAKAAMKLALSHIQGAPGHPPDPEAARPALELALGSQDPGVQAMALAMARQIPGGEALPAAALPAAALPSPDPADLVRSKRPAPRPFLEGAAP